MMKLYQQHFARWKLSWTSVSSDSNYLEPLTPNHFFQLKAKARMPPGVFEQKDLYSRSRWRQVQHLAVLFRKWWTKKCLPIMQEISKWNSIKRNVCCGDVVIIVDNTTTWSIIHEFLGAKTLPDAKSFVRSVLVKTKTNVHQPIDDLCLLMETAE